MNRTVLLAASAVALAFSTTVALAASPEAVHTVKPGETLNGIANRAGVPASAIIKANGLKPPYVVKAGQKIEIPQAQAAKAPAPASASAQTSAVSSDKETSHVVRPGETFNGIANRAGVSASALAKANGLEAPYAVRIGQKLVIPRGASAQAASRPAPKSPSSAPATGTSPEEESQHVVQPGETLGGIAVRAKVPRVLIIEANGLQPPYAVKVGQKLQIPRTRRYTVAAGDTGFSISLQYGVPWEQIALANSIDPVAPVKPGQSLLIPTLLNPPSVGVTKPDPTPSSSPSAAPAPAPSPAKAAHFGWPVTGAVRRDFSTGSDYHDGLDIAAPKGTMVRAAAAGTVKFAGKEKEQFGNLVVLDHGDGWFTAYGFLSRITVREGAKVAAGERIGLVGDTGKAKGSELHFEVRQDGKPVNPLDELPKAP